MNRVVIDYLGWASTAVFVASYFFTRVRTLRRIQMAGALMWAVYGLLLHAVPVVVANVLVFGAAVWTSRRIAEGSRVPGSKVPGSRVLNSKT